jgi:hypothetical protein
VLLQGWKVLVYTKVPPTCLAARQGRQGLKVQLLCAASRSTAHALRGTAAGTVRRPMATERLGARRGLKRKGMEGSSVSA